MCVAADCSLVSSKHIKTFTNMLPKERNYIQGSPGSCPYEAHMNRGELQQ